MIDKINLCFTDEGIPVLGGIFSEEDVAIDTVKDYISLAKKKQNLPLEDALDEISLEFIRQTDKRYTLIINLGTTVGCIEELANIDELMLRRFKKGLEQKSYFILTSFFVTDTGLTSTMASHSLGLIIYKI